jgi:transcriptional regulator with XRE-family HTH domain
VSELEFTRPVRSPLLAITPLGAASWAIEAITSYILRLAHDHRRLTLNDLVLRVLPSLISSPPSKAGLQEMAGARSHSFNGRNGYAEKAVEMLHAATLRGDLRPLTLLPWGHLLVDRDLLRETLWWCPACLAEAGYERLIWFVAIVTTCPSHHAPLVSHCPGCGNEQSPLAVNAAVGACRSCGISLAGAAPHGPPPPWELWIARQVGELLATEPVRGGSPRQIIRAVVAAGTTQKRLAGGTGLAKSTVSYWMGGKSSPTLEGYLRVANAIGCSLVDLLSERVGTIGGRVQLPESPWRNRRTHNWTEIQESLKVASLDPASPSLNAVAGMLGIDRSELRRRFRSLTDEIAERFTARRRVDKAARLDEIENAVTKAVDQLIAQGDTITTRNLERVLDRFLSREDAVRDAFFARIATFEGANSAA